MPALDIYTSTFLQPAINPEEALASVVNVNFAPSVTIAQGTLLGKLTATGKYAAYDNGAATGLEVAVPMITQYAVITNADGNITNFGTFGGVVSAGPVYTGGYFRSEDLTGVNTAGLTDIGGVIVSGDLTTGMIKF